MCVVLGFVDFLLINLLLKKLALNFSVNTWHLFAEFTPRQDCSNIKKRTAKMNKKEKDVSILDRMRTRNHTFGFLFATGNTLMYN